MTEQMIPASKKLSESLRNCRDTKPWGQGRALGWAALVPDVTFNEWVAKAEELEQSVPASKIRALAEEMRDHVNVIYSALDNRRYGSARLASVQISLWLDRLLALLEPETADSSTVEQRSYKLQVEGSTPSPPTIPAEIRGDGPCEDCGGDNISWFTLNVLWNEVNTKQELFGSEPNSIVCIVCWVKRAAAAGYAPTWLLVPGWPFVNAVLKPEATPTCDGSGWVDSSTADLEAEEKCPGCERCVTPSTSEVE